MNLLLLQSQFNTSRTSCDVHISSNIHVVSPLRQSFYNAVCITILTRSSAKMNMILGRFWFVPSTLEISNKTHHHLPDILIRDMEQHHSL